MATEFLVIQMDHETQKKPCTRNWIGTVYIPTSLMPTDNHNNGYTSKQILLPFSQAKRTVKSPLGTNRWLNK